MPISLALALGIAVLMAMPGMAMAYAYCRPSHRRLEYMAMAMPRRLDGYA